jgi:hypothetical protein
MPDWKRLVRARMAALTLPPDVKEEVIAELAIHLEEIYEHARSTGLADRTAIKLALQEVHNWRVLATQIRAARSGEGPMNPRTKRLWLPAMASLVGAAGLLMILQKLGIHPRVVWIGNMAMVLYLPWLIALPIFGAVGALLARQHQAGSTHRLVAGLAPSLAMLGSFLVMLPLSLAIDRHLLVRFPFGYFALTILNWVVVPACALLVGALPFLKEPQMTKI